MTDLTYLGTPLCRTCSTPMLLDPRERTMTCPRQHGTERYSLSDEGRAAGVVMTRWREA
jgi:hypothetical protein